MHVEGIQMCQINRWNNSFQNMYGMKRQQLIVWPGKSILCKKTPHFHLFWWTQIWVTWLWKDLDAKRLTPGQLQAYPWKLWGMTVQTSYVGGRWHQNWAHTSLQHFYVCALCNSVATNLETRVNFGQPYLGLKTPYHPLPYIFWTPCTWGFTRYHLTYIKRPKNLVSRVALLPGKFLQIRKAFVTSRAA